MKCNVDIEKQTDEILSSCWCAMQIFYVIILLLLRLNILQHSTLFTQTVLHRSTKSRCKEFLHNITSNKNIRQPTMKFIIISSYKPEKSPMSVNQGVYCYLRHGVEVTRTTGAVGQVVACSSHWFQTLPPNLSNQQLRRHNHFDEILFFPSFP